MYLRRSALILPRTICLNRLASLSIFRTTALIPRRWGTAERTRRMSRRRPTRSPAVPRGAARPARIAGGRPCLKIKDRGEFAGSRGAGANLGAGPSRPDRASDGPALLLSKLYSEAVRKSKFPSAIRPGGGRFLSARGRGGRIGRSVAAALDVAAG